MKVHEACYSDSMSYAAYGKYARLGNHVRMNASYPVNRAHRGAHSDMLALS